ncbi:MAG: proteinase inhibitor [Oxalobacteraceae bacterium]|nr:proteinase inhibitor [Oxalobacteraceae bacterium]
MDESLRCRLFGLPERPAVCSSLLPSEEMCGPDRECAMQFLHRLELLTAYPK